MSPVESPAKPSDSEMLLQVVQTVMPFGKYAGRRLIDLPEPYVVWFSRQGFPRGKLGRLLQLVYEVKVNGLEHLFDPLRPPGPEDPTSKQKKKGARNALPVDNL